MKITKLMLSAAVAALALVSCNKQDTTPTIPNRLKTVEISVQNAALTKGLAGNKIENGQAVLVKDFKVFLTDAAGNEYTAKTSNGAQDAPSYWTTEDLSTGSLSAAFHYVDPNCTRVVAVANIGKDLTFAEYKALANLKVADQQKQDALILYAAEDLKATTRQHNDENDNGTTYVADVYEAKLTLTPRISRFEVDGFSVIFNGTDPLFDEINFTQLAIQNYYPETSIVTGAETGTPVLHMADLSQQAAVYTWLDDPAKPSIWYRDYFDVTVTPADPAADIYDLTDPTVRTPLAYHVFAGDEVPVFVIKLIADGQPAYIYTKNIYVADDDADASNDVLLESLEEGKIYRMSAKGDVEGDGSIPIPEDKIDPMDRCLEITVEVIDWTVELVYPEF